MNPLPPSPEEIPRQHRHTSEKRERRKAIAVSMTARHWLAFALFFPSRATDFAAITQA